MNLRRQDASGVTIMIFSGEYDLTSIDRLRPVMEFLVAAPSVVLELSDVTYVDSSVISELVRLHNARASAGREPETLVVRHPNLIRLFRILDLSEVFHIVAALDDAVAKNGRDAVVAYASAFEASLTA